MSLLDRNEAILSNTFPDFSVMTWNLLADQLACDFPAVEERYLDWEYRKKLIQLELQRVDPDLLCVQELDHYQDFLEPEMSSKNFDSIYKKKPDWHQDGTGIFYNKSKFTKIDQMEILFPGSQFALGLLLEWSGKKFYLFSTHLKAKEEFDSVRVEQLTILLNYIEQLEPHPVILCGDFNSQPGSNAYNRLANNTIGLVSAYRREGEPSFTTIKKRDILQIKTEDYIWQRGFQVTSILDFPTFEAIGPNGLPSCSYPSDHLSLASKLSFL
jgi:nocturnin